MSHNAVNNLLILRSNHQNVSEVRGNVGIKSGRPDQVSLVAREACFFPEMGRFYLNWAQRDPLQTAAFQPIMIPPQTSTSSRPQNRCNRKFADKCRQPCRWQVKVLGMCSNGSSTRRKGDRQRTKIRNNDSNVGQR